MAEQRNIHTTGIILKKHAFGENDFSVTLYSPDLGKIQATAKGARKITGSLNGHIETLNLCNFQLYKSPVRYTIVQCQVRENFKKIRQNFEQAITASMIVEIFHKSTISNEHAPELFALLEQSLHKLSNSDQHFLTVESFKLNLLQQIGALPDLQNCGSCHERWNNTNKIWLEPGGHLRCQNCVHNHRAEQVHTNSHNEKRWSQSDYLPGTPPGGVGGTIEFNIIKLINYLTQPLSEQTKNITFNPQQQKQLRHITHFFLQHFLEREIVSEKILMAL